MELIILQREKNSKENVIYLFFMNMGIATSFEVVKLG